MQRDSLLDKIRALLSKTTANGCTEPEALAALDKARAMMDAYEVTDAELQLTAELAAVIRKTTGRDPHSIKSSLAMAIARFCDCKVWRGGDKAMVFCGLPSDAEFAEWLLDTLTAFVQAELASHLMGRVEAKGSRRFVINGFVAGCTRRISARLNELSAQSKRVASSNSTALVVTKDAAVSAAMAAAGINLRGARRSRRRIDGGSYAAGQAAGERASFGRPVDGAASARIGG